MHSRKALLFSLLLAANCLVGLGVLYSQASAVTPADISAIAMLGVLALISEGLSLALPESAAGSIAFIPYLALAFVVPGWASVATVMALQLIIAIARRNNPLLSIFNASQLSLTVACVIGCYLVLGGVPLLEIRDLSFLAATMRVGLPVLVAFACSFALNGAFVCTFLALRDHKSFSALWRTILMPSLGFDMVVGPVVFIFAWLFTAHGAIAAAALWVPLLGLREVHKANLALQRSNEELLELMVKSIEARDMYTSGHSRRVHQYSLIIARALGLGARDTAKLGKAALLHDVGKIYEKYAPILRKPEKLSQEEWATMKEHPVDGANLVATISSLKEVVPLVRHHHENWDGSGYPDGLRGDQIPLTSRIISFADTIDAMTSERPYRQPLTEADVRSEILRHRGRQFDPEIADRLLASHLWITLFQPSRQAPSKIGLRLHRSSNRETA